MINTETARLEGEIWQILDTLKGATRMSDEELEDHRKAIKQIDFNPTMPIDTVFNKITQFMTLSTRAGKPITPQQAISLAMLVIKKTSVFSIHITDWNRRPLQQRTWRVFKTFFRNAQLELRESNSLTSQQALLQMNANMVAEQVTQPLLQHPVFHMEEPAPAEEPAPPPTPAPAPHQINNTGSNIETMMQQLMQMMINQQQTPPQQPQYQQQQQYRGGGGRGGGCYGGRGERGGRGRGPIIFNKYCWTHGLCTHTSAKCRNRAQGYKENATLTNRMGGSDRNL